MRKKVQARKPIKAIISWIIFIGYINIFPPTTFFSFLGFYFFLSFSLFTGFRIFLSRVRGATWTTVIFLYLMLRQLHLDNLVNNLLLFGILIIAELYFRRN